MKEYEEHSRDLQKSRKDLARYTVWRCCGSLTRMASTTMAKMVIDLTLSAHSATAIVKFTDVSLFNRCDRHGLNEHGNRLEYLCGRIGDAAKDRTAPLLLGLPENCSDNQARAAT